MYILKLQPPEGPAPEAVRRCLGAVHFLAYIPGWSVFQAQGRNVSYPTEEKLEMFLTFAKAFRKCFVPPFYQKQQECFISPSKRKKKSEMFHPP